MHNVAAAVETERMVAHFKPLAVMLSGVAGGIKDVRLGDVVAATKIYAYEAGKDEASFKPRPEIGESTYALVQRARAVARDGAWASRIMGDSPQATPKAFVGPMAAGEKIVGDTLSPSYSLIRQHYGDALAVEMEGYGFLHAAFMNNGQAPALVVRGISDLIKGKEEADQSGSQPRAAAHAAAFAFEVLANLDFGRTPHTIPESDWFRRLETLLTKLYPTGPNDRQVWSRAGGDVALIEVANTGLAAWHLALKNLEQGGGGKSISPTSLLDAVLLDYPNNPEVKDLLEAG